MQFVCKNVCNGHLYVKKYAVAICTVRSDPPEIPLHLTTTRKGSTARRTFEARSIEIPYSARTSDLILDRFCAHIPPRRSPAGLHRFVTP